MNAVSQLYMAGLGHLVMVSNGQLYMNALSQLYMTGLGHHEMVNNGQMLHECSISGVYGWSGSSCNCK